MTLTSICDILRGRLFFDKWHFGLAQHSYNSANYRITFYNESYKESKTIIFNPYIFKQDIVTYIEELLEPKLKHNREFNNKMDDILNE